MKEYIRFCEKCRELISPKTLPWRRESDNWEIQYAPRLNCPHCGGKLTHRHAIMFREDEHD